MAASDLASVLLTEEQIQARVAELARQIAADYEGQNPLLVGVLKGSVVFLSDLVPADCASPWRLTWSA